MTENSVERRRLHAFALREFFQEQWDHLLRLLGEPGSAGAPDTAQLDRALESLVEGTDARMRLIIRYRKRLRSGVRALLDHVERTVARLPSAQPLNRRAFSQHPLLNALFVGPDDLQRTVSQSAAIQDFLGRRSAVRPEQLHALLTATPCEKRVLGMALTGDTLMRDVLQTALNFCDRRVEHPAFDEGEVRRSLEQALYGSVVTHLRSRMARCKAQADSAAPDLNNPQHYLDTLTTLLQNPAELLQLESRHLCVSKLGVLAAAADDEPVNEFTMDELVLPDTPRRLLLLVLCPVSELLDREGLYGEALRAFGLHPPGQ